MFLKTEQNIKLINIKIYNLLIGFYVFLSAVFFFLIAKNDIENATNSVGYMNTLGIYADHPTYVNYFRSLSDNPWIFFLLKPNYIGPFFVLYASNDNLNFIFIFNLLCLFLSLLVVFKFLKLKRLTYVFLLLINPITFISLFSVNKEIITLLSVNMFIISLVKKNNALLFLAVIIGVLARKELSIFFVFFHAVIWFFENWHRSILKLSFAFILLITVGSILIDKNFSSISDYSIEVENTVVNSGSGGTILLLNDIQKKYGYIWVVIPKIVLNLVGSVLSRTSNLFFFENVYNDIVVWGQSFLFLFILPWSYYSYKKKHSIYKKKFLFAFILSCILFAYIPVIQNRYFYVGYLILIVVIAYKDNKIEYIE